MSLCDLLPTFLLFRVISWIDFGVKLVDARRIRRQHRLHRTR